MKRLFFLYLGLALTSASVCAVDKNDKAPTKAVGIRNVVYGTALLGAALSFRYWLPSAQFTMNNYGVWSTLTETTYFHRLFLDCLTMGICAEALYQLNTSKSVDKE
ncbi:MAG: hypothetical protein AB7R69_03565 [Candidatus Babeliales bacterium]